MSNKRIGYKMTELGEIPEDWEIKSLGQISEFSKGKGIPKKDLSEHGKKCVLYGQLYTTYSEVINDVKYFTDVEIKNPVIGMKNDLLIPSSGETAIDIATAAALNVDDTLIGGDINIFRPNQSVNSSFLSYQINSIRKRDLSRLAQGSSVYHLYSHQLEKFSVILPNNIFEQTKIASILSTVDEQIDETEQLIVKTKELKKGLMQQLLTKGIGHTEFKQTELGERPSKWDIKQLRDVLTVGYGKNQKDVEVAEGEIPILGTGGIIGWSNRALFDKPSVLIGRKGTIDKPRFIDIPFWTIDTLFYTDIDVECASPKFIYYLFQTIDWYKYNEATGVPSLSASNISKIVFACPSLDEQQKIAQILSTVDEQIEVYEQEKAKYEELKKGLMQKLLTGQIRVKV